MNPCDIIDFASLEEAIPRGTPLLVAVSGGADSMALLCALRQLDCYPLKVVHVNHGLRGREAKNDELFVENYCKENVLEFHCLTVPSESLKNLKNVTLEEALRNERHRLFEEKAAQLGITHVAIGHNADDMVESFLMHLLRGTGAKGLIFRFATKHNALTHIRPLWKTHRLEIVKFCEGEGIPFVTDRTNYNTRFTRNRIRHKLLPFLENEFNPQARQALLAAATSISDTALFAESNAPQEIPEQGAPLPIVQLLCMPAHRQSEVLYSWLTQQTTMRPTNNHITAALELARRIDNSIIGIRLSPTQQLTRYNGSLLVVNLGEDTAESEERTQEERLAETLAQRALAENPRFILGKIQTPIPVVFDKDTFRATIKTIAGQNQTIEIRLLSKPQPHTAPKGQLILRNRQPADIIPCSSVRIKHLFNSDKVPAYLRDYLLMIVDEEGQVFAISYYPRIQKRLTIATAMRTQWEIVPDTDDKQ
ncbi:tRNA lysidine(34) synthetase TilS [Candidatus Sumerlaeota bacterium]|nr:tRNA lysidine(34) synthetase TilS [Candidatus Sumerlaeota bacterium]